MWLQRLASAVVGVAIVFLAIAYIKRVGVVTPASAPTGEKVIGSGEIAEHGPYVVVNVNVSKSGNGFLNIGGIYPNQTLTIFIAATDMPKFYVDSYSGKKIVVRGMVTDYKGKPEIIVTEPNQIRIVP